MDLQIGNKYKLALSHTFDGIISLNNMVLRAQLDLRVALGISNVIDKYAEVRHALPENLKELDLDREIWLYFSRFEQDTIIIVPSSFVIDSTIIELESIEKTFEINFAHSNQYTALLGYLSDQSIPFRESS